MKGHNRGAESTMENNMLLQKIACSPKIIFSTKMISVKGKGKVPQNYWQERNFTWFLCLCVYLYPRLKYTTSGSRYHV